MKIEYNSDFDFKINKLLFHRFAGHESRILRCLITRQIWCKYEALEWKSQIRCDVNYCKFLRLLYCLNMKI